MSHKTMIDGVSYEISGGKTLINGTAYSIDKGKTLVGGTAYEVWFDNGMRTVTIIRDYDGRNSGRVYIDGNRYLDGGSCEVDGNWLEWTSPITIEVPVGTQIILETEYEEEYAKFVINGAVVYDGEADYAYYEQYTVTKNATITMSREHYGYNYKYILTITEE